MRNECEGSERWRRHKDSGDDHGDIIMNGVNDGEGEEGRCIMVVSGAPGPAKGDAHNNDCIFIVTSMTGKKCGMSYPPVGRCDMQIRYANNEVINCLCLYYKQG